MNMERVVVRGEGGGGGGGMRRRKEKKKMKNAGQCGGKMLRLDSDASPLVALKKNKIKKQREDKQCWERVVCVSRRGGNDAAAAAALCRSPGIK